MTAPYQLLPPLSEAELEELRASIRENGVMVAVLVDEDGAVIDGHHRQRIADELGIDYPVTQRAGLTEADKRSLALSLNLHRRHLSREQKRDVIAASLVADPELSNRQHAERVGASHHTVGDVRDELEGRGQIAHVENRTDTLGRSAPATKPSRPIAATVGSTSEAEVDRWVQAVSAHPFLDGLAPRHQVEAIDGARQLASFTGNEHAHRLEMFRRWAAAAHKQGDNPPEWQRSMQLADLATHVCNLAAQLANKAAELVRAGDEWEPEPEHLALLPDALTAASQAASEVLALISPATQIRRVK